jgi:hypothetical protein
MWLYTPVWFMRLCTSTNKNSLLNWPAGSGEQDFLKIFSIFLLFCDYLPLEKGNLLHLNNLESPCPKDDLCQVWLKLALWFWRRSWKCKSLHTDKQTDGWRTIRIAHLSFQLRWAKNEHSIYIHTSYVYKQ